MCVVPKKAWTFHQTKSILSKSDSVTCSSDGSTFYLSANQTKHLQLQGNTCTIQFLTLADGSYLSWTSPSYHLNFECILKENTCDDAIHSEITRIWFKCNTTLIGEPHGGQQLLDLWERCCEWSSHSKAMTHLCRIIRLCIKTHHQAHTTF